MGCACTRPTQTSDESKNDLRTTNKNSNETDTETDLSKSASKYVKIKNDFENSINKSSLTKPALQEELTTSSLQQNIQYKLSSTTTTLSTTTSVVKRVLANTNSPSTILSRNSAKHRSNNSLLRPFTNLFNSKDNRSSSNNLDDSVCSQANLNKDKTTQNSASSLTSPQNPKPRLALLSVNSTNGVLSSSQNQLGINTNRNSACQLKQNSQQSSLNAYSLHNLPIKTQFLLNSHEDIEKINFYIDPANESSFSNRLNENRKLNKEIQVYVSRPHVMNTGRNSGVLVENDLLRYNLGLIENHLNDACKLFDEELSLFDNLRNYCAQHEKISNCDLNLISLSRSSCDECDSGVNLLTNKYFRRSLGKSILNDLFNIKTSTNGLNNQFNSFLSSFSVFVIFLSETQFENDTTDNLLCPDQIELIDFRTNLETHLTNRPNLNDLFHKWYKLEKAENIYKLETNFFNLKSQIQEHLDEFIQDLEVLIDFFLKLDDENFNSNEKTFKLKYIKTVQQEEIEIIVHHADPQSIIWAHLTNQQSNCSDTSSSSLSFNKLRYLNILNLLQAKVLTNKYKQIQTSGYSNNSTNHKSILDEFVHNSVRNLIDTFLVELNKNQIETFALRIDKQLSQEIFKHYEYFKYLKTLDISKPTCSNLEWSLNEYTNEKLNSYKHPFLLCNGNASDTSATYVEINSCIDFLMSKWLNQLIHNNQQIIDDNLKPSIIYRFCNHTILSSEITTLLQSVLHQLCYILEIHESCAFDSPENITENVSKALEFYFKNAENERKEILIILSNIDSLIKTNYDLNLFLNFLNKFYYASSTQKNKTSNLKLILTLSNPNTSILNQLLLKIENQFIDHKTVNYINLSQPINKVNTASLNDTFSQALFSNNSESESNLVNLIVYLLNEARYGIKQSELLDIITTSDLRSKKNLTFLLTTIWYSLKYFSNSIEFLNDNNQILYKIPKLGEKLNNNESEFKFNDLIYSYYNRTNTNKHRLISSFNNRVFHELPKHFYLNNKQSIGQIKQFYLNEFILNPKWILNKTLMCSSLLYFIHDIAYYKKLFHAEDTQDDVDLDELKLKRFESFLYKRFYNLNQDQNQFYLHAKLVDCKSKAQDDLLITNLDFVNKSINLNNLPHLILFNSRDFRFANKIDKKNLTYCDVANKELVFYSKVVFLSKYCFLTLSEQPFNEIKIWKIVQSEESSQIDLIRTIKLNKSPRDLRLLNKHTAVVLIERNLHLIDLNNCSHVFDLNSTMNPNLALFEIHDSNHVVLLARNRLSVILMKVPTLANSPAATPHLQLNSTTSDDMFLFKVGEDRYLNSLLVSKNGKIMVCGDEVQKPFPLLVWNLNQRKLVYDLRQTKHEFITSIQSIGSSGKFVVSACQEEGESKNCLIVYDLTTGQLFKKLKARENFVCVEVSEEANVIIACLENSQIVIYDLANGSKKFTINSNRFPINKIKILDTNKNFKNLFLTYDTLGYDWTIRLWDLTKGDELMSSITCPSRIVSLDVNCSSSALSGNEIVQDSDEDDLFITACLYAVEKLFVIKLDFYNQDKKIEKFKYQFDMLSQDEALNGLHREINL